jgi:hypothetical protein
MSDLAWLGVTLLMVCVVMIGVEGFLLVSWTWNLAKRARLLSERMATEQLLLKTDVDQLMAQLEVTAVLWRPYGRALRWMRHPLAIALLGSFARRRAPAR